MAQVLILELDPVFAAVVEDRLHVSGHESRVVSDPALAVSLATEGQADLLVMQMELPGAAGIDLVRRLRRHSETRSLPIVVLSQKDETGDRIAAFRAGVDDFLGRPCDPEELMLRLDRLLGSRRMHGLPVLQGDLESQPIWEIVQYIQQASQSGELVIHGQQGSGRVRLDRGCVLAARWQSLRGRDAVLAILDMKEGGFRLTPAAAGETPVPADAVRIHDYLIEAAWIGDLIKQRRRYLPATGVPLELKADVVPPVAEKLPELPLEKVFDRIRRQPGVRLYELVHEEGEAPSKVRLAVAWLAEQGVLAPVAQALEEPPPSTIQITTAIKLEFTVNSLLLATRKAGLDVSPLSYLLLAEAGAWPRLRQLLTHVPADAWGREVHDLVAEMDRDRGGRAVLETPSGSLALHVRHVGDGEAEDVAPECAGVLVWLDEGEAKELVRRVVDLLEAQSAAAVGMFVAATPAAARVANELTGGTRKWQISAHAPQSLLGVLRLLHPREAV